MKSCLSSGKSRCGYRLLVFSCLIFLKCDASQTAADQPKSQVEPSNWLLTAKGRWPEADGIDLSSFYIFYTEGSAQAGVFGLNPLLLTDETDLASKWQLYFRYATNSQTTIRSRNKTGHQHEDSLLDQTDLNWRDSVFTGVDQAHWNSTLFLNFNEFLLALKNVQVKYTEKLGINKLNISPVHGFKKSAADSTNGIAPFASVDPNILRDRPSSVYYTGKEGLRIDLTPTPAGPVVITLKILGLTSGHRQVYSVTLTPNAARTGCDNPVDADGLPENIPDDVLRVAEINCSVNQGALRSVTIRSKMDSDFLAIWNVPGVVSQLSTQIENLEVYTVEETTNYEKTGLPFLNLNETGDACYSLLLQNNVVADVYLTLEGLPRGLHLKSINTRGSVCLNEVIALENLKNYQITVALQEVAKADFHMVITKKSSAPLTITELSAVGNQIDGSWHYYSSLVNYEMETIDQVATGDVKVKPTHEVEACDVAANCVPMVESVKDGAAGKKILSYTIDEPSKKIFAKSPLIRFKGDLSKLTFTKNVILTTKASFQERVTKLNAKKVKPLGADAAKPTQFSYTVIFDEASAFQTEVIIPLDQFDFRLTNVKMSLEPMANSGQIELVQFSYNNGWDDTPYVFPAELFKIKLTEKFTISSDSLFVTAPTDLPHAPTSKRQLSFTLRNKDGKTKAGSAILVLEIASASKPTIGINEHEKETDISKGAVAAKEIHTWPKLNTIPRKHTGGLITNWIQSAVDKDITIESTGLKTEITVSKAKGNLLKPIVYRVLLGQREPLLSLIDLSETDFVDPAKTTIRIVDDISKNDNARTFVPNGPFRVAYLIHSTDNEPVTFKLESLKVKSVPLEGTTNCELASRQGPLNCKYQPVLCADGFEADSDGTICQQRWLYNQTVKECDPKTGCGNIFSRSFLQTKFTAEPNVADAVYVPYQIADSENTDTYLQVNRQNSDPKNNDFCLDFGYAAMNSTLRVSLSPELSNEKYAIFLPRFTKDEVMEMKTVCASHLSAEPETVKSLYIRFGDEAITTLDNHYVGAQITEKIFNIKAAYDEGIYLANYDSAKSPLALKEQENITRHFLSANRLIQGKFFKLEGASLVYRVTNDDVQMLKANYGDDATITDSLQTRWFKPSTANRQHVRLSLKANNVATWNSSLYDFRAILSSTSQRVLDIKTKEKLLDAKTVTFNDTSTLAEYYKVELFIYLDLSQITDEQLNAVNVNERFGKLELVFDDFSVNDPCVTDDIKVKVCTKVDRGACGRKYREFSSVCDCYTGFHGDQCQN